jgi:hypothetical protein
MKVHVFNCVRAGTKQWKGWQHSAAVVMAQFAAKQALALCLQCC